MTGSITRLRRLQALSRRGRNETGARRQRRAGLGPRQRTPNLARGRKQTADTPGGPRRPVRPALAGDRRTLPAPAAAAAPPPRPRATSTIRSNVAAAAPPAGRHFRVRRLATPTLPAVTSGSRVSLLPPGGAVLPGAECSEGRSSWRKVVGRDFGGGALCRDAAAWRWIKGKFRWASPPGKSGGDRGAPRSSPVRRQQPLATPGRQRESWASWLSLWLGSLLGLRLPSCSFRCVLFLET